MSIVKIAKEVGVSHATISRALNMPEKVHPDTLLKIQRVCKEMNYTPRVISSSLKAVTLIVPPISQVTGSDTILISRMVSLLSERGYNVLVCPESGIESLSRIFRKAFIVLTHDIDAGSMSKTFGNIQVPIVAINDMNESINPESILIGSDHHQGISMAMHYLLERGHKRIAYISMNPRFRGERERLETYSNIMREQKEYDESLIFANDRVMLPEGLSRICSEKATAILVADASLTLQVLYYLKLFGSQVPNDISMITLEVAGSFEFLYPPITAFVQPTLKLADLAVEMILAKLRSGGKSEDRKDYIPYEMIIRESVKNIT